MDTDCLFGLVLSDPEFEGLLSGLTHYAAQQAVAEAMRVLYAAPAPNPQVQCTGMMSVHASSTILYHTVQSSTILYNPLPYCTILYHTAPSSTILYHPLPYCTILYHTLPQSTILHHTLPYCIILYHTVPSSTIYCTILYHTLLYTCRKESLGLTCSQRGAWWWPYCSSGL